MPSSQSRQSQQRQQQKKTDSRSRGPARNRDGQDTVSSPRSGGAGSARVTNGAARGDGREPAGQAAVNQSSNQSSNGNAAVDAELVRLTSGAVISLLGLAEETGGVPNDMWRDPYALGFVYGTVCGLSVRVLASEDAELAPVMETVEDSEDPAASDSDLLDSDLIDSVAVETAVAKHDLAGVMSESFHDILQFSYAELSAAPSLEGDLPDEMDGREAGTQSTAEDNGAVVLARAADLMLAEQPDFLDGLRAADKVVALALGFPDYDADVDVIDARRRADAARIDLADIGMNAPGVDGLPADPGDLGSGKLPARGDDMIIDITKLIADPDEEAEEASDFDDGAGDLYLLSQDEAAVLYLQQRLFCREIRRRLSA
ncbi:hypothetical protein ACFPL7_03225 [Dongia soli]|uniref:Uncharacterized protein n=1 Tax=Dongia soli TaxID=600628 RepID=A0ABU5EEA2_9PROT|nr:hypothetical protein [Dongia soli]MDY0884698.1 hypothetical protein [Dongia soli]